jgi:hypothetical protein
MAISKSTFRTNEVMLHLSHKFPFGSRQFYFDMQKYGEIVPSSIVEKWFKNYFPSNVNQFEFRTLESCVTQTVQF